jgi:hypothetical protein
MAVAPVPTASHHSATRIFAASGVISVVAIIVAYFYGGWKAAGLTLILGILEITLSFDNAVVNATVLRRMNAFWQKIFLTVGVLIAGFGMRLLFPLLVVSTTTRSSPLAVLDLAINRPGAYAQHLEHAHPAIAAFGGVFLLISPRSPLPSPAYSP